MWDEITYPFPNINCFIVEVWKWISNFTPHFTGYVITYPYWGYFKQLFQTEKGAAGIFPACSSFYHSRISVRIKESCFPFTAQNIPEVFQKFNQFSKKEKCDVQENPQKTNFPAVWGFPVRRLQFVRGSSGNRKRVGNPNIALKCVFYRYNNHIWGHFY